MCKRNKWLSRAGAALCAVLMLTAFSGCNGNGGDAGDQIITPSTDSTGEATDAVTEPTEAPTEAETTTTTAAPLHPTWAMSTLPPCTSAAAREPITAPSAG